MDTVTAEIIKEPDSEQSWYFGMVGLHIDIILNNDFKNPFFEVYEADCKEYVTITGRVSTRGATRNLVNKNDVKILK